MCVWRDEAGKTQTNFIYSDERKQCIDLDPGRSLYVHSFAWIYRATFPKQTVEWIAFPVRSRVSRQYILSNHYIHGNHYGHGNQYDAEFSFLFSLEKLLII